MQTFRVIILNVKMLINLVCLKLTEKSTPVSTTKTELSTSLTLKCPSVKNSPLQRAFQETHCWAAWVDWCYIFLVVSILGSRKQTDRNLRHSFLRNRLSRSAPYSNTNIVGKPVLAWNLVVALLWFDRFSVNAPGWHACLRELFQHFLFLEKSSSLIHSSCLFSHISRKVCSVPLGRVKGFRVSSS